MGNFAENLNLGKRVLPLWSQAPQPLVTPLEELACIKERNHLCLPENIGLSPEHHSFVIENSQTNLIAFQTLCPSSLVPFKLAPTIPSTIVGNQSLT